MTCPTLTLDLSGTYLELLPFDFRTAYLRVHYTGAYLHRDLMAPQPVRLFRSVKWCEDDIQPMFQSVLKTYQRLIWRVAHFPRKQELRIITFLNDPSGRVFTYVNPTGGLHVFEEALCRAGYLIHRTIAVPYKANTWYSYSLSYIV